MMKLLVNVEAQTVLALLGEAAEWEAKGDLERAARVRHEAANALAASGATDPHVEAEQMVPLSDDERKQQAKDAKAHAAQADLEEKAAAARQALAAKLASGKATPAEVQQALAQLLA